MPGDSQAKKKTAGRGLNTLGLPSFLVPVSCPVPYSLISSLTMLM